MIEVDKNEIEKHIPHRDPFIFVDRMELNDDGTVTGFHKYTGEEFFFKGHFPAYPVVPGVLLVEAMAQCGGAAARKRALTSQNTIFFLATVNNVKLRRQVRPGDEIRMVVTDMKVTHRMIRQQGKCYVGEELAAEAEWMCICAEIR